MVFQIWFIDNGFWSITHKLPIFDRGVYKSNSSTFGFAELDHEGKVVVTSAEDRVIGSKIYKGVLITIVGTVIWGFGDLLNNVC